MALHKGYCCVVQGSVSCDFVPASETVSSYVQLWCDSKVTLDYFRMGLQCQCSGVSCIPYYKILFSKLDYCMLKEAVNKYERSSVKLSCMFFRFFLVEKSKNQGKENYFNIQVPFQQSGLTVIQSQNL
jgi:hypothetical protein